MIILNCDEVLSIQYSSYTCAHACHRITYNMCMYVKVARAWPGEAHVWLRQWMSVTKLGLISQAALGVTHPQN